MKTGHFRLINKAELQAIWSEKLKTLFIEEGRMANMIVCTI